MTRETLAMPVRNAVQKLLGKKKRGGAASTAAKPNPSNYVKREDRKKEYDTPDGTHPLVQMLRYRRPSRSQTEEQFIERFIDSVKGMNTDTFGNRYITIPESNGEPPQIMWSSHTDSVHDKEGFQSLAFDPVLKHVFLAPDESVSNCLGADCATGVYIMLGLISRNVPGLYVFHREEECGGQGSDHFAKHERKQFEAIRFCVALDRKDTCSIITGQMMGRCASNAFAEDLSHHLAAYGLDYDKDPTGTFTDSANYQHLIPECTNLSVGYYRQHSKSEYQDLAFADKLLESLAGIDWRFVLSERDPDEVDDDSDFYGYGRGHGWGGGRDAYDDLGNMRSSNDDLRHQVANARTKGKAMVQEERKLHTLSYEECRELVDDEPMLAAWMLAQLEVSLADLDYYERSMHEHFFH